MENSFEQQAKAIIDLISNAIDTRVTADFLNANQNERVYTEIETEQLKERAKAELMEKLHQFQAIKPNHDNHV